MSLLIPSKGAIILFLILSTAKGIAQTSDSYFRKIATPFLGKPYVAGTLEKPGEEHLIINLDSVDCTTFVEYVVAQLMEPCEDPISDATRSANLIKIRYRGGILNGYCSRLHYFSDWINDNLQKGVIEEITEIMGGEAFTAPINYMSMHPNSYPRLKENPLRIDSIRQIEKHLNQLELFYIPKSKLNSLSGMIKEGDIIAITTTIKGLDIAHVGFAYYNEKRVLHLLHASQTHKKVVIDPLPLYEYLMQNSKQSGIRILRMK